MSFPISMSRMRQVCSLCCAVILSASVAHAQSAESTPTTQSTNAAVVDSSANSSSVDSSVDSSRESSSVQIADFVASDYLKTLDGARSGAAAGGAAGGQEPHGWVHHAMSNLAFEAGGGFNAPTAGTSNYLTFGGNFTVGGGMNFSKRVALLAEYQFMDDKLPGNIIAETGANGGYAHIWSLTLDPVIDLMPKAKNDVYVTGGGGFYRKVTSFTDPEESEYCYYFCEVGVENAVVGHFSSNQGGLNVGAGFQHRTGSMADESRMKIYAEVRYLYIQTPAVGYSPNGLGAPTIGADTRAIPVTFGVRW
jgi:hypothetical protein